MANKITVPFEFSEKGLKDITKSLDNAESSAKGVAAALSAMADEMAAELARADAAAEALATSLGPDIVAKLEQSGSSVDALVAKFQRLGLSFEEIETDADELAAAVKKLDGVKVEGITSGAGQAKQGIDGISDSARGANSALANMIGNSAQDIGALGGIAGSAGVAIGQMAEYASDATLAGEALGASLKSMALVAGPIAALTIGMELLGRVLNKNKDEQKELAAATNELVDALIRAKEEGKNLDVALGELAKNKVNEIIADLGADTDKVVAALEQFGIGVDDLNQAFRDGDGLLVDRLDQLAALRAEITANRSATESQIQTEERVAAAHGLTRDELMALISSLELLDSKLGDQVNTQRQANTESQHAADYLGLYKDEVVNTTNTLSGLIEKARGSVTALAGVSEILRDNQEKLTRAKQLAEDFGQAIEDELGRRAEEAAGRFQAAIDGVLEAINAADAEVRGRLNLEGLLDDIKAQFEEVNETADDFNEDGEAGARRHREAVRQLRLMMLDLIGDLDNLSANDKIRLTTEVERGSVDDLFRLLGELQKGVTVPVSFSTQTNPGFESGNISIPGGGGVPSLGFQNAIPPTVIVYPPIGTTPTSITEQGRDYLRRFGPR